MRIVVSSLLVLAALGAEVMAQMQRIEQIIDPMEAESHLRFLTSDELKGRNTGSEELVIAGRYIAEQFRRYGVKPLGDLEDDYFQAVPLRTASPASEATVSMIGEEFRIGKDLLVVAGSNGNVSGDVIYLKDLMDYKKEDLFLMMKVMSL